VDFGGPQEKGQVFYQGYQNIGDYPGIKVGFQIFYPRKVRPRRFPGRKEFLSLFTLFGKKGRAYFTRC